MQDKMEEKIMIAPSIMCISEWQDTKNIFRQLKENGIAMIHADVMDGKFVPNLMLGTESIKHLREVTDIPPEIIRDATVYGTKYVTVVEIMGRNAGWLTAAAALAKGDDCEGVDMICLPEVPFNVDHFIEKVRVMQEKKPSIVIAVSEGVKLEDGRYVCELADDVHAVDAFGHKALTGTARFLANTVARSLDTKTRCIELSTLQRCAGHLTSRTDITEAYQVGGAAAKAAFEGVTGQMVALKRISNSPYQCTTELHPISEVANLEKKVPLSWMNENHTQMTEDFLDYARPLIQAELTPLYIAGLPHHIYLKK